MIEYKIIEDENCGVILKVCSELEADSLDDFLTEERYVLYDLSTNDTGVDFMFGEASSVEKVKFLVEEYQSKQPPN